MGFPMLIQNKSLQIGDVANIRLTNGEEVIGKLVDQDSSSITLTKPILLVAQMMPNGQAALQFAPFMVGTDEDNKYVIARSALSVLPMKARKEIADNYLQATSSIVPAGAGLVV